MSTFLNDDLFLHNNTSKALYHSIAENLPIIDYHSHIDPQSIAVDKRFYNVTELWLKEDHYKWRLMRANGVDEYYITGQADDFSKFEQWARTLEQAAGNPVYIWSHMELKRYFGYDGPLSVGNAKEVWDFCNKKLQAGLSARQLLSMSDVRLLCTTDDPISSLRWHKEIAVCTSCSVKVLPTFRPDKILAIDQFDFIDYIKNLSECSHQNIYDFRSLQFAIQKRIDYFFECGCLISDHSLEQFFYCPASDEELNQIFNLAISRNILSSKQINQYRTAMLIFLAKAYAEKKWVMQLHFGVVRNVNRKMYDCMGSDSGFDCIGDSISGDDMIALLNHLNSIDSLPKTILYSLNPNDNARIDCIVNSFPLQKTASGIQHGCAWWFNDHKEGIKKHLESLSSLGLLGNFVGMLTDSRSLLSYVRHEYFRRILCDYIGTLVENGEFPYDSAMIETMIKNISYHNCKNYFNFDI